MASRLHGLSVCFLLSVASRGFAQPPPSIRIDTGEADAVLKVLSGRGNMSNIGETEGYTRLKSREAAMGRAFSEDEFAQFLDSEGLRLRKRDLQRTLARWKRADMKIIGKRVRSYLPSNANLRATVYIVIKPRSNSFVYDLAANPAIFLYLDPQVTKEQLENTIAHELHLVGLASLGDASNRPTFLPANVRQAMKWTGAFGEGLAMLAAAGGQIHRTRGKLISVKRKVAESHKRHVYCALINLDGSGPEARPQRSLDTLLTRAGIQ